MTLARQPASPERNESGRGTPPRNGAQYPWWAPSILFVLAVILFGSVASHGYVLDAVGVVVRNEAVNGGQWARLATTDWWDGTPGAINGGLYRPVAKLWLAALYKIWGGLPGGINLLNLVLHGVVAWLRFTVFRRVLAGMRFGDVAALVAAAAAMFHPVVVEVVGCQVGAADLLAATFMTGAIVVANGGRVRVGTGLLAGALAALGVLSKESAAAVVPLAIVDAFVRAEPGRRAASVVRALGWSVAGLGVALAARYLALHALFEAGDPVYNGFSTAARMASACATLATHTLALIVAPFSQLPVVTHQDVLPAAGFGDPRAGAGAMILVALVAATLLAWSRGARAVAFGLAWFLGSWIVTSNLMFSTGAIAASRFLYVPISGLALAAVAGLGPMLAGPARWRQAVAAVAAVWFLGVMPVLCARQFPNWKSEAALYEATVASHPGQAFAAYQLANIVLASQPDRARDLYRTVVDSPMPTIPGTSHPPGDVIDLKFQAAMNRANVLLLQSNDFAGAKASFEDAIRVASLGEAASRALDLKDDWRKHHGTARREVAKLLMMRATKAVEPERSTLIGEATEWSREAASLDPDAPQQYGVRAQLAEFGKKPDERKAILKEGRTKFPDDPSLKIAWANELRLENKNTEASRLELEALDALVKSNEADPVRAFYAARAALQSGEPSFIGVSRRLLQYVLVRGARAPALQSVLAEASRLLQQASTPPAETPR